MTRVAVLSQAPTAVLPAAAGAPVKRLMLLALFVILLADEMFGWGLGIATGLSVKNVFLYLLLIMLALEIAAAHKARPLETYRINLPFLLLIAWACYSWMANTLIDFGVGYEALPAFIALKGSLLDHYLFFLAFFLCVPSREEVLWMIHWIMAILILANLVTLIDAYDVPDLGIIQQSSDGRVSGPLGEPNQYGAFAAMFLPAMAGLLPGASRPLRVLYGVGCVLLAWVLLLTVSRGAFVGLIVGVAAAAFVLRRYLTARMLMLLAAGGAAVFVIAMALLGDQFMQLLETRTVAIGPDADAYELSSGRTWIWTGALTLQLARPIAFLTGFGWDTFLALNSINSHNTYLTYLFELGLPGVLLYLAVLHNVFRTALLAAQSPPNRAIAAGFLVGFLSVSAAVFFVNLAESWYFIWAYIGLMARLAIAPLGESQPVAPRSAPGPEPPRARATATSLLGR